MIIRLFFIILVSFLLSGCHNSKEIDLKTGDLLFRGKTQSKLSEAIDDVTQTGDNNHFSHVGMVEIINDEPFVIHADGLKGVCIEPIDSFLIDTALTVEAFRLKPGHDDYIDKAIERAREVIGAPYNFSYIIGDEGYYCSELIWYAFKPDSVFSLEPMTFKDSESGEFHPGWIEHYQELEVEIPEGLPGCNPNGLAASDKLFRVGELQ